jgi:aspartate kinase
MSPVLSPVTPQKSIKHPNRIVQKFGGTSVQTVEKIQRVAKIIADTVAEGNQVVAVVSAMGHSTDALVALAKEICDRPSGRDYDALLATGEMVTASLTAMALNQLGCPAIGLNGPQAGIHTENIHNSARILTIDAPVIEQHLNAGKVVIVTGFQGVNDYGDITTLGRGGSDTSAVALAGELRATRCDIFTDVRGVYSTDPRIVPEAVKLDKIAYIEMLELARVGAQVLHPRAVETARQADVTVRVRSTFHLEDCGTLLLGVDDMAIETALPPVAGIACDDSQARLALRAVPDQPGVAAEIFGKLAQHNISVDMIIQSLSSHDKGELVDADLLEATSGKGVNDIAFTIHSDDVAQAVQVLEGVRQTLGAEAVVSDTDIAKISIVGAGMVDRPGIAADMFEALAEAGVNIKMIATSEIKISCLVEKSKAKHAIQVLHRRFFPQATQDQSQLVDDKLGY